MTTLHLSGAAKPLITVTLNPAFDRCAHVPVVESERKLRCADVTVEPGGGGVNVARVVHRLGVPTIAAVLMGGESGDRFRRLLWEEGVPAETLPIAAPMREDLTVVETSSGRQYRFVLPGPTVSPAEISAAIERVAKLATGADFVVVSGSLPPGVGTDELARLLRSVRIAGPELIMDVSGDALGVAAEIGTRLIKPSARELSHFAGAPLSDIHDLERAARQLLALGDNDAVVASLGAAGGLLVPAGRPSWRIHAPTVPVVSTVGAGDSLVAGMVVALARGSTLLEAVRLGVAAGSAATTHPGTGLCCAEDVERLLPHVTAVPLQT